MHVVHKVYGQVGRVYINGSHADCEFLSWYERPTQRNNQGLEQQHTITNRLGDASAQTSSRGTFERWIEVARKQERLMVNRQSELKFGAQPKLKRNF